MGNQGFWKITGAPFTRIKPNLCPFCQHFRKDAGKGWYEGWDVCAAKQKYLSNPHTETGRCPEFAQAETPALSPEEIELHVQSARDHKADKANRL
ncbi:MAG TPA: hypothetical protein VHL10_05500 [Nitrososphaera sp.]|jgi:hypothetical protein|nr:hypothetical protein [Nitrososphaera sp.]